MRFVLLISVFCFLISCGDKDEKNIDPSAKLPPEILYAKAAATMDAGKEMEAQKLFADVERLYPYSEWSGRSEMMAAYAAYSDGRYEEAVEAADGYIALHPGSADVAYAWYLRALSYYAQIADSRRDQGTTDKALAAFTDVIERFPETRYARDALIKRDLTLDHLAGHEMEIGRYYLRSGHLGAAAGRFEIVVERYQTTTHVPEALERLVEIYVSLGLEGEAKRVAAILGHNYPGSARYERAYTLLQPRGREELLAKRTWKERAVEDVLGGQ